VGNYKRYLKKKTQIPSEKTRKMTVKNMPEGDKTWNRRRMISMETTKNKEQGDCGGTCVV
jgi:hypothetical protein